MSKPTGGPAFPVADMSKTQVPGMTMRDWFAGQALLVAFGYVDGFDNPSRAAAWAYDFADAMLKERDR